MQKTCQSSTVFRVFICLSVSVTIGLISGCSAYSPVGKTYRNRTLKLEVELPGDWLRFNRANTGYVMTRDGIGLEMIEIRVNKTGKKLADTKRVYRKDMLPHELAELTLSLIKADDSTNDFRVEGVQLKTIAGLNGYHADAIYVDENGLRKRLRIYGAVINEYLCEFRYLAADKVYFDKYVEVFEKLVSSVAVRKSK